MKCGLEKGLTEYYRQSYGNKPHKNECKECEKKRIAAYNQAHRVERRRFYLRNPGPYRERAKKAYQAKKHTVLRKLSAVRERNREFINARKQAPCTDCGRIFPFYVMDFDHVRGTKAFNISKAASQSVALEALQAEIDKCELVCANCHRIRSYTRKQHITRGVAAHAG